MSFKVAFLGPLGTYSHQATVSFFGASIALHPVARIQDVFEAVSSRECEYGMVPVDNSTAGLVEETSEALRSTTLSVRGMEKLRIGHALLSKPGIKADEVTTIYSHTQGLMQCAGYLKERYPSATPVPVNSTSKAAQLALEDPKSLAICSIVCAEVYGLSIVDQNIQDAGASNTTRFLALSLPSVPLPPSLPIARPVANGSTTAAI